MEIDIGFIAITALTLACIYALLALGVSIVFASLGLINMAHGLSFAVAGYGAWATAQWISASPWAVLGGGVLAGAVCGVLICSVAFIPLHDKPNFVVRGLVATLAISLLGTQALLTAFGPSAKSLPALFGTEPWNLAGLSVPADKGGAVLCALLLMGLTLLWMTRSRMGLQVRAMMPETLARDGFALYVRRI